MAGEMAARGEKVLVVDIDESNFGLYKQLGLPQPRDFMDSFGGKKGLGERMRKFMRSEGKEKLSILGGFLPGGHPGGADSGRGRHQAGGLAFGGVNW